MTRLAPRRPRLAAVGIALAGLTAVLATSGALTGVDQFAVSHLMPWLEPRRHPLLTVQSLTLPSLDGPAVRAALDVWTYPASFAFSLLVVLACAARLPRAAAAAWLGLWLAGNTVELVGKLALDRPALSYHHAHVVSFDDSLPSGHTIRSLVVAGALAATRRHGRLAYAWAATLPFALVVLGAHTPTDVVAGASVAVALLGWAPSQARVYDDGKFVRPSSERAIAGPAGEEQGQRTRRPRRMRQ